MENPSNQEIYVSHEKILVNELKAGMLSLELAGQRLDEACFDSFVAGDHLAKYQIAARLYIDNNAVIALINKGRVKWSTKGLLSGLSGRTLYQFLNYLKF